MGLLTERLLRLWLDPDAGDDAFHQLYADPVSVNGATMSVSELVARARALRATYADMAFAVVDEVQTADRLVLGFRMTGRHVGPLATPLGTVPPTGRIVENRVTDILTLVDGRVTDVWVVSDDLSVLTQLEAITLR
jgi:predicted ester cyclase